MTDLPEVTDLTALIDAADLTDPTDLPHAIRSALIAAADAARAPAMQAYMKSEMPYLGVVMPEVRRITRAAARERPPSSIADLAGSAKSLWRGATFREMRYAAAVLLALPIARGALELLPLHQEMIVTGAWWDHVDEASHRIGDLLRSHRAEMEPVIRSWATADDRWLRRVSVICQLDAKADTDLTLLSDAILANAAERDFFLRKAIGWALRQYSRTDADWVRRFLDTHRSVLSPLSVREAAKHL